MGSVVEINDTLQITKDQGFPKKLDISQHLKKPYKLTDFQNEVFEFRNKPKIRIYHLPPVRVFLVENVGGKWIYWGLVQIIEVRHDCLNQTTSGKFRIIYINTPAEMKQVYNLTDRRPEMSYFDPN